jgi:hypothetical protein
MHTVYKTVNLLSGRFYIGYHKTENPNDDYLGSGLVISFALRKYGRTNFKKIVLFTFEDAEQAFQKEKVLVAAALNDPLCYNIKEGGDGGFDHINRSLWKTPEGREKMSKIQKARPRIYSAVGRANLAAKIAKANGRRAAVRWIHKDGAERKVLATLVPEFKEQGWSLGRPLMLTKYKPKVRRSWNTGKHLSKKTRALISASRKKSALKDTVAKRAYS